jgi:uncharacterized OsmC-like protein
MKHILKQRRGSLDIGVEARTASGTFDFFRYTHQNLKATIIKREISFSNLEDEEIRNRILLIANKCPISKILENQIIINKIV